MSNNLFTRTNVCEYWLYQVRRLEQKEILFEMFDQLVNLVRIKIRIRLHHKHLFPLVLYLTVFFSSYKLSKCELVDKSVPSTEIVIVAAISLGLIVDSSTTDR